jgi:TatD DNase family protein
VPIDFIVVETDSPYLVPTPFRGKVKINYPEYVVHTARFVSDLKEINFESFATLTFENGKRLFGIK